MSMFLAAFQEAFNQLPHSRAADSSTITVILNTVFGIMGAVAVLVIVLGGIRYIVSHGDVKIIQDAKNQIFYAVLGLVVIIMATAIVNFVLKGI